MLLALNLYGFCKRKKDPLLWVLSSGEDGTERLPHERRIDPIMLSSVVACFTTSASGRYQRLQ